MQATKSVVISCAGIGSRLGLGQTKALIQICGRSLISWQLELLKEVEDVRIVIGYQARDVVREVLKMRRDIIFVYNHNYFSTKTGASYYLGSKDANEFVIEWDGDLLVHPDDVRTMLAMDDEFVGYADITSDEAVFVRTNASGEVIGFSHDSGDFEWTGPASMRKSKLQFTAGNVFDQIAPHLPIKGLKLRAYDIDTYEDYKRVGEFVKNW